MTQLPVPPPQPPPPLGRTGRCIGSYCLNGNVAFPSRRLIVSSGRWIEERGKALKGQRAHHMIPSIVEQTCSEHRHILGCDIDNLQELILGCPDGVLADQIALTQLGQRDPHILPSLIVLRAMNYPGRTVMTGYIRFLRSCCDGRIERWERFHCCRRPFVFL
jgi:hypothetical protein